MSTKVGFATGITPVPVAHEQTEYGRPKVIVALPAYNEGANIGRLLDGLDTSLRSMKFDYKIVVVDDGSKDNTLDVLKEYEKRLPLVIERHIVNQGLGATITDGLRVAARLATDDDVIITMDADGTHLPGLMPRMVQMIDEGRDVVIASRYQPGAQVHGVPVARRFMSWIASWIFRVVFPTHSVRDYTCGYRAYRGSIVAKAVTQYGDRFVEERGFQCMAEILLKIRALHAVFGEVPMILRYDLKEGKSKMRVARTVANTLKLLVQRRLRID
jgi:dolichol-phosphate mannosyltransferase